MSLVTAVDDTLRADQGVLLTCVAEIVYFLVGVLLTRVFLVPRHEGTVAIDRLALLVMMVCA